MTSGELEGMVPEHIYVLFAEWELAHEQGREFDFERIASTEEQTQLRALIEQLSGGRVSGDGGPPDAPVTPGETARYRFTEFIARGGMGDVWRGVDKQLGRPVALKVLQRKWGVSQSQFREEALLVARLSHPGIVPVYDLEQPADDKPFFAMKLVEGKTLEQWLTEPAGHLGNQAGFLHVFRQICQTLAYAHAQSPPLIHRDLKPQNVMVGPFGEVYVMDWGIAKTVYQRQGRDGTCDSVPAIDEPEDIRVPAGAARQPTSTGVVKGTMAYMAPEQFAGDSQQLGPVTDVFGLGGILFRMLTGTPPFTTADQRRLSPQNGYASVMERLTACQANAGLVAIVSTCLKPWPAERYQHAGEVLQAVVAFEAEEDRRRRLAEIAEAQRRTQIVELRRRRRWQVSLGALALLLLAIALGFAERKRAQDVRDARRREQLTQQALLAQAEAGLLLKVALDHPLQRAPFQDAAAAAKRAVDRASAADHAKLQRESQVVLDRITSAMADIPKNERFLTQLAEARLPPEPRRANDVGPLTRPQSKAIEDRYLAAFRIRKIELNLETLSVEESAARLKGLPKSILPEVAAALDELWIDLLLFGDRSDATLRKSQNLIRLAYRLDDDRRAKWLREKVVSRLLGSTVLPSELDSLVHEARTRDLSDQPVSRVHVLYHTLRVFGQGEAAELLLVRAVSEKPHDVSLLTAAALLHERLETPEWDRAGEYRRAVTALHPDAQLGLVYDLLHQKRWQEAEAIVRELIQRNPKVPECHLALGICLSFDAGRVQLEKAAYLEALRLRPNFPSAQRCLELVESASSEVPDGEEAPQSRRAALK